MLEYLIIYSILNTPIYIFLLFYLFSIYILLDSIHFFSHTHTYIYMYMNNIKEIFLFVVSLLFDFIYIHIYI